MSNNSSAADQKRDELRMKIEASERRIAERTLGDTAREMAQTAGDYAKANPLQVVGGAVAVGILIGLMTKPGRRVASQAASNAADAVGGAATSAGKSVGNAVKQRSSKFGSLVADALVAYGIKLIDEALSGARASQDKLEDIGDNASAKAREIRRDAGYMAGSAADKTRTVARRTRRRAERAVRDLTEKVGN